VLYYTTATSSPAAKSNEAHQAMKLVGFVLLLETGNLVLERPIRLSTTKAKLLHQHWLVSILATSRKQLVLVGFRWRCRLFNERLFQLRGCHLVPARETSKPPTSTSEAGTIPYAPTFHIVRTPYSS